LLCKHLSLFLWAFLVTIQENAAIGSFVCCLWLRAAFLLLCGLFITVQENTAVGSFAFCLGFSFSFLRGLFISIEEDTRVCLRLGIPGGDQSFC
jgi:hypothetical protein